MSNKPFDYLNSINFGKNNMMRDTEDDDEAEKGYVPFLTNRTLSYSLDTILHANMMNERSFLDNRPQYEFLLSSIRKKKRFAKWHKPDKSEDLDLICNHYKVNPQIGREYLDMLPPEEIERIREINSTGGTN